MQGFGAWIEFRQEFQCNGCFGVMCTFLCHTHFTVHEAQAFIIWASLSAVVVVAVAVVVVVVVVMV